MEGLLLSPAGGWVTSAPIKITGSRKTAGLEKKKTDFIITASKEEILLNYHQWHVHVWFSLRIITKEMLSEAFIL